MEKIILNHLYKIYDENKENQFIALNNISLHINDGEMIVLRGKSGSGKSTLLSILGGISKPTQGDVVVNGQNIAKLPDLYISKYRNEEVGFIFQSFNLISGLNTYENVMAPLMLSSLKGAEIHSAIDNALKIANIEHKSHQEIASLSGGEKQRCAIARALVKNPNIILADEPTANLDKENSLGFIEILKQFKSLKKTVVVATHDALFDHLDFVDRYIDISDGKLI